MKSLYTETSDVTLSVEAAVEEALDNLHNRRPRAVEREARAVEREADEELVHRDLRRDLECQSRC